MYRRCGNRDYPCIGEYGSRDYPCIGECGSRDYPCIGECGSMAGVEIIRVYLLNLPAPLLILSDDYINKY